MPQGFNGQKIIETLLGWFRYAINSVISMASGSGGGLIKWLAESWLGILITLLVVCSVVNIIIYMVRWRPHWWWFAKKRMVVSDSIFEPRKSKPKQSTPKPVASAPVRRASTLIPKRKEPGLFEVNKNGKGQKR